MYVDAEHSGTKMRVPSLTAPSDTEGTATGCVALGAVARYGSGVTILASFGVEEAKGSLTASSYFRTRRDSHNGDVFC